MAWAPGTRDRGEWPGLVLEVGYSQTFGSLRMNARWWLEKPPPFLGSGIQGLSPAVSSRSSSSRLTTHNG